ncbi:hypothetical protein ACLMJK_004717 [Lecanora helva]
MAAIYSLRPPTTTGLPQAADFRPPAPAWLKGTWHVTHSTLPMWKSKRNVTITYEPLPPSSPSIAQDETDKFESTVAYQTLSSEKVKTVKGTETSSGKDTGAYDWRGKGWLIIASSHWEVLGYGELEGEQQWAVTYFAKTLFTPAGIDIYSRTKEGLPEAALDGIKTALAAIDHEGIRNLTKDLFVVKRE